MITPGPGGQKASRREAESRRLWFRLGILGAAPLLGAIFGLAASQVAFCLAMSAFWGVIEASLHYRAKLTVSCRRIPFILRLLAALCLDVQACWLLAPDKDVVQAEALIPGGVNTLSVVLPCANESDFVLKTIKAIYDATPEGQLHEIIIVDDNSLPVISQDIPSSELTSHRARIIRHDTAEGLIRSKKHGADSATGDIIVFLDCHVKPVDGWTEDLFSNIRQNPKRIVVPTITALDPDTWQEVGGSAGGRKMCLTWNADFYWCNGYPGPYVPIMSGGLLALSRYWWEVTGGYDGEMKAWGGENLDQSLRTWLCGGEIVVAAKSRVAHMWRDPSKPKTVLHYSIPTEHVLRNRLRAATSWMGDWAQKVRSFPEYDSFREGGPWHVGSLANVDRYKTDLQCKGFKTYLDRFEDLYSGTGMLPSQVFNLRDKRSQLCLHHELTYGSQQGGKMVLRPCNRDSEAQRWHLANSLPRGGPCCSGIKLWDIDICIAGNQLGDAAHAEGCFNFGESINQHVKLSAGGQLEWREGHGCIAPSKHDLDNSGDRLANKKAQLVKFVSGADRTGTECKSRIELLNTGEGREFRIVSTGNLCLSISDDQQWIDNGRHLLYRACEEGNRHQVFTFGHDFDAEHRQIKTSDGFCIDAADASGPVAYECHPVEDESPQQTFIGKPAETLVWHRRYERDDKEAKFCIEPMDDVVNFAACAAGDGTPKVGQGFVRHDKRDDGSFQLKIAGTEECLTHVKDVTRQTKLAGKPCKDSPDHRWKTDRGQIKNVALGLCIDANNNEQPILYTCYTPGHNKRQEFKLHENGLIEIPKTWADNGRVRYLAKCFDTRPVDPIALKIEDCKVVGESGSSWEQIWQETPLETQLFLDASGKRGNLRSR